MNLVAQTPAWSRRRWLASIGLVFLAQLVLVVLLGDRPWGQPKAHGRFGLKLAERSTPPDGPTWDDPTLFALAHPRGFSGPAWMRLPPQSHQYYEWNEATAWLTPNSSELGAELTRAFRTPNQEQTLIEKPVPEALLPAGVSHGLLLSGRSVLHAEGDMTDADVQTRPALPVIAYNGVLGPSVVQAVVDELGRVFSTSLVTESGSKTADLKAVQLAKALGFSELKARQPGVIGRHYRFARLIFQWQTSPLPQNAPAAAKP